MTLSGCTVAIPESRELDLFAALLERLGAHVLRCPLLAIVDAPDPVPIASWIAEFNLGSCDDLILYTGEGLKRLLAYIDRLHPSWRSPFVKRLGQVRRITRGPKPCRVLRELELKPNLVAKPATTDGLIALMAPEHLQGRRIGVQLYGRKPDLRLIQFLNDSGAQVLPVTPYIYADSATDAEVVNLIERLANGDVDAIAFTSAGQVERLNDVAVRSARRDDLLAGLSLCVVAAVGPVVSEALFARGFPVDVQPTNYALKPLARCLNAALSQRRIR